MNKISYWKINEYIFGFLDFWKLLFLMVRKLIRFIIFFSLWSFYAIAFIFGQLENNQLGVFYIYCFLLSKVFYLFTPIYTFFFYISLHWLHLFEYRLYLMMLGNVIFMIWVTGIFCFTQINRLSEMGWNYLVWIRWQWSFFWLDYFDAINPFVGKRWEYKRQNYILRMCWNLFWTWGTGRGVNFFSKKSQKSFFSLSNYRQESPYANKRKYKEIGHKLSVGSFKLIKKNLSQVKLRESWRTKFPNWLKRNNVDFQRTKHWRGRVRGFFMPVNRVYIWDKSRANIRKLGFLFSGEM